ncbi:hypothetical protein L1987_77073 [Smallanthus sonchifolius]|uniref:Uncharacterized protein n=1 Tax=Smallanthus sonchifolius TaxID=185202 RepID=A0ACB8Z8J6_9ASTR|nr:hypothetical protein L1987_77073 [Smallanthus sonchifolius]
MLISPQSGFLLYACLIIALLSIITITITITIFTFNNNITHTHIYIYIHPPPPPFIHTPPTISIHRSHLYSSETNKNNASESEMWRRASGLDVSVGVSNGGFCRWNCSEKAGGRAVWSELRAHVGV